MANHNKYFIVYILITLFCLSCRGQQSFNKPNTNDSIKISVLPDKSYKAEIYDTNRICTAIVFLDKRKQANGPYTTFFSNGNRKSQSIYLHGVLNGESFEWFENGLLSTSANYINGLLDGERIFYNEDGSILSKRLFSKGRMVKNLNLENDILVEQNEIYNGFLKTGMDSIKALEAAQNIIKERYKN